jgi:aa3 type cytochrome c oxidase subunit IV
MVLCSSARLAVLIAHNKTGGLLFDRPGRREAAGGHLTHINAKHSLNGEVTPRYGRNAMDDHGQLEYATASGNDYPSHEQMYRTFVTLTKCFVAVIAVIVILMAIFLT